ncbi:MULTISPECIES: hypothetical protein [Streptomyces]|uniref:hypothetical protein n=1 Tax=Streptomyces TaxID=1883 RepID=UPI00142E50EA|nr:MULTISPECIES: hypothetical protein [Streptomyces]
MSPANRTTSLLGPVARDRFRKAGVLASLALIMATGVVSPAKLRLDAGAGASTRVGT